MELIFEVIYELFLEGTSALVRNKKLARPLRILFLTLLLGPFFAIFLIIFSEPGVTDAGTYLSGFFMALLILGWLWGVGWIILK